MLRHLCISLALILGFPLAAAAEDSHDSVVVVLDGSGDVLCRATGAQLRPLAFWLPIH